MFRVVIRGKAQNIRPEESRAWAWASLIVLGFHNWHPKVNEPVLKFKRRLAGLAGEAYREMGLAVVKSDLSAQDTFTTILHEFIHVCKDFPEGTTEKCTSTLCAKLKPHVAQIAELLVNGTYQRAALLAHTKISYPTKDGNDFYDGAEDQPIQWNGDKFRPRSKLVLRQNA